MKLAATLLATGLLAVIPASAPAASAATAPNGSVISEWQRPAERSGVRMGAAKPRPCHLVRCDNGGRGSGTGGGAAKPRPHR